MATWAKHYVEDDHPNFLNPLQIKQDIKAKTIFQLFHFHRDYGGIGGGKDEHEIFKEGEEGVEGF